MSCAPVRCHVLQNLLPRFDESTFDVEVKATVFELVDVPEDVGSVSRLLELVKQGCAKSAREIPECFPHDLIVTAAAAELREHGAGHSRRLWLLVVDIRLEE